MVYPGCEIQCSKSFIKVFDERGFRYCIDGLAVEQADGGKEWRVNGKRHRDEDLAVECIDGLMEWWVNGECHCLDGPTIEQADVAVECGVVYD